MTVFIDTSALLPQLNPADDDHDRAIEAFSQIVREQQLVTHNYVVVEATALVQARLGIEATRTLTRDLLPLIDIRWVDEELHRAAASALLAAGRRETSLVDWTSFEVMRREGIDTALAFDRDFVRQGFRVLP